MPLIANDPLEPIYRLSVKQYHRMIEAGVLTEEDPVELLEGRMVTKMPRNPVHDGTISMIQRRLEPDLGDNWFFRIQSAITTRDSEPEPDLAAVSGPNEKYLVRHPAPYEVGLVVEVAESSLRFDQKTKGRTYARARIPIYWIANLVDMKIELYTSPVGGKSPHYRSQVDYGLDDLIPFVIEGKTLARIPVKDLLPRSRD